MESEAGFVADEGNVKIVDGEKLHLGVTELFKMYLEDFHFTFISL